MLMLWYASQGLAGLSEDEDDEEEAEEEGAEGMSWLERLSDTDTSNLSQIDWAEIERLVATEEIWWILSKVLSWLIIVRP